MMTSAEIKEWLKTVPDEDNVAVSDGGLTLVAESGGYLELGGGPAPEDPERKDWPEEIGY